MRKVLAALLALCVVGTSSLTALATEPGSPVVPDMTVGEQQEGGEPADNQQVTDPEDETTGVTEDETVESENGDQQDETVDAEGEGQQDGIDATEEKVQGEGTDVAEKELSEIPDAEDAFVFVKYDMAGLLNQAERAKRPFAASGEYFGDKLSGDAKTIYDSLVTRLKDINQNGSGSNKIEIKSLTGSPDFVSPDVAQSEQWGYDAVDALLKDYPGLIYWIGKDDPLVVGINYNEDYTVPIGTTVVIVLPVIDTYKSDEKTEVAEIDGEKVYAYTVQTDKGGSGASKEDALKVAGEIVNAAKGTDYQKIQYFNKAICELTSYDQDTIDKNLPYGDSYQMLNVFLGKPVVCEGYAKAFKYLCDESGIGCHLVEGQLQGGNHMWNYVELDGEWYIVDVTNNDGVGTNGYDEHLLAIGSDNTAYKGKYDPTKALDGKGKPITPLNPDVKVSATNYDPAAHSTVVNVTMSDCTATGFKLALDSAYVGNDLTTSDITIQSGATAAANITISKNSDGSYAVGYDELTAGKEYTVSLDLGNDKDEKPYTVKFKDGKNTFIIKAEVTASIVGASSYGFSLTLSSALDLTAEDVVIKLGDKRVTAPNFTSNEEHTSYSFDFNKSRLEPGTYTVSIPETDLYKVTFDDQNKETTNDNQFVVKARFSKPDITFSQPDKDGKVTASISVPGLKADKTVRVRVSVNNNGDTGAELSITGNESKPYVFDRTTADGYLTKNVWTYVYADEEFDQSEFGIASYTFPADPDQFQCIVKPVTGLKGEIKAGTVVANLSTINQEGTITYELDWSRMMFEDWYEDNVHIFKLDGTTIKNTVTLAPETEYTLYVIATDGEETATGETPKAYGQATVTIGKAGGSTGGGGGASNSGSGSSSTSTSTGSANVPASKPLTTADAAKSAADAVKKAPADAAKVDVVVQNVTTVNPETFKAVAAEAAKSDKDARLLADTVGKDGKIVARVYVDTVAAGNLANPVNLSVSNENKPVSDLFGRYFSNEVAVVKFEQKGGFGMTVQVAVKVDLTKLNVSNLAFYSYDAATNTYAQLPATGYYVDTAGYLHFNTSVGNNIIITDAPLTVK